MKTRQSISGFDVMSRRTLPEYRAEGVHLVHAATGCEILHLATADQENLFAFCFATPPRDDTGVSHIIEHSVLSGSRRFPVKEPFSVLMKGSLNTFLNALTYPDRTVYPASSCNRADFFNLMLVYGDAVFHPLLRRETFMQEAWRLEEDHDDGEGGLGYAGVVYNEMKGAYSSPDSVVSEWALRSLFPDTPYRFDSGGNPSSIPDLTIESARDFHARYYHPSNCRIFLYGDIPMEDSLAFIRERLLAGFTAQRMDSAIPLQKPWDSPRRLEKTFPVKPETPLEGRSSVTLSWLLPPVTDAVELVTHELLSEALVESAGSPLRKALVDSGLGEDLSPVSGLEVDLKQMLFAVGLRGTDPGREEEIRTLVLDTLSRLCTRGLDKGLVGSMMDRIEFRHREIKGGGSPYSLRLMSRTLRGWVHGADPFDTLEFAASMQAMKKRIEADDGYLEKRMERSLLANPHRLTLVVRPDPGQEERDAAEERAHAAAAVGRMSDGEREAFAAAARAFKEYQAAPDSPESLALLPSLRRSDIPPRVERIPVQEARTRTGVPLSLHDIFTNEIIYLDLAFPTDGLSSDAVLLLPLFGRAVCGMGTADRRYDEVALELSRLTGGFSASLDAGGMVGEEDGYAQFIFFRTRCLRQNVRDAFDLVGRLLAGANFRDLPRLRDILLELRNDFKSALIPNGHQFAMLRAASMLSDSVAREEQWRGVTQMLFLERLTGDIESRLPGIAASLEAVRAALLVRPALISNATAAAECFTEISAAVDALAARLPAAVSPQPAAGESRADPAPKGRAGTAESLVASAQVGYVARAVPGYMFAHALNGPVAVLGHMLSTGYLWDKVRMEGGAYGAFSFPRNMDGLFLLGSYRDPRIIPTLNAFEEGLAFMETGDMGESEVEQAVIGTVGREDRPLDPGEKGFVSLQRALHRVTDEARQDRRTRLLATDRRTIAEVARGLREGYARGFTAVIANRAALQEAAAERGELDDAIVDLPE